MRKKWTDEEIEILKRYYPIEGRLVQSRLPSRTLLAIKREVVILGIKKNQQWTEDEDEILRKYYQKRGAFFVSEKLGRSQFAVRSRARVIGVTRKKTSLKNQNGGDYEP